MSHPALTHCVVFFFFKNLYFSLCTLGLLTPASLSDAFVPNHVSSALIVSLPPVLGLTTSDAHLVSSLLPFLLGLFSDNGRRGMFQ